VIDSSSFVPFHNSSEFLMEVSQFFFHIAGFLSFIKLLFYSSSNLSVILICNNFLLFIAILSLKNLRSFLLDSVRLVKINSNSLYDCWSSGILRFVNRFIMLLRNTVFVLSLRTLVSLNFLLAFVWFSRIITLSQFTTVKRTFRSKFNHFSTRIRFLLLFDGNWTLITVTSKAL